MRDLSVRCGLTRAVVGATCVVLIALLAGCSQPNAIPKENDPATAADPAPSDAATPTVLAEAAVAKTGSEEDQGKVKIGACDGSDPVEVAKDATGQALADSLMDQWKRTHPQAHWVAEEQEKHGLKPPADNSDLLEGGQAAGNTYGNVTRADLLTWSRETEKFVAEGSRIFHDATALGSTVSVSCDMCHPNAANTHPETYPKFQTQLGRVVLLRDMINWCVQNPVRGAKLDPDGPTMRALEAYIMAQRQGVPIDYGKH
jgi:thiosulfate dehydrogenase